LLVILANAAPPLAIRWLFHPIAALTSTIFHTIILAAALYYLLWKPEDVKGDLYFALLLTGLLTALFDGSIALNRVPYTPKAATAAGITPVGALLAAAVAASAAASLKRPRLAILAGLATMALLAYAFAAQAHLVGI